MSNLFIKLNDEDIEKLLLFVKPRRKSQLILEALIFYIINSDKIDEFANPPFKDDFEKILKKIRKKRSNFQTIKQETIEKENKTIASNKQTNNTSNDDFEKDEF